MLEVYLKKSPLLKVGMVTDNHSFLVHDEFGKPEGWVVTGVVRSLTESAVKGMWFAEVEDVDLDYQVQFIHHR